MVEPHFERLSAIDLSFLAMEDGRAHMHIGSVSIYEGGPLRAPGGGIDLERILGFTAAQLPKFPRLRQRLAWVPGFGQPGWVDDEHFNLDYHVRHTALPPPGDVRQLKRLAGRILSQEFDRSKPLWEFWFVEGLDGDRIALIAKMHHCLADGISGVALGNVLVGPDPAYEPPEAEPWTPRPAPGGAQLVVDEVLHRVTAPVRLLRPGGAAGPEPGTDPQSPSTTTAPSADTTRSGLGKVTGAGLRSLLGDAVSRGSPTPLNLPIGPHRRFDWTRLAFAEVHAIAKAAGGTVNDVVLAIATGALRSFLQRRDVDVDELDFRAVVPVNMRGEHQRAEVGNRVAELIAHLPLAEADPWQRLVAAVGLTRDLKASGQSATSDLVNQAVDLLPAPIAGALFRLASRSSVANIIITNVPGPRVPVYLLGARQLETYPVVPLLANQALGIALMSYDDGLFWGFNADWDVVPDLHDLVKAVEVGFAELAQSSTS